MNSERMGDRGKAEQFIHAENYIYCFTELKGFTSEFAGQEAAEL